MAGGFGFSETGTGKKGATFKANSPTPRLPEKQASHFLDQGSQASIFGTLCTNDKPRPARLPGGILSETNLVTPGSYNTGHRDICSDRV